MDNNNNPKKEPNYITTGAVIGASQTVIGHPIDTLKTLYQNKNSKVIEKIYHESVRQDIQNKKPKFGVILDYMLVFHIHLLLTYCIILLFMNYIIRFIKRLIIILYLVLFQEV